MTATATALPAETQRARRGHRFHAPQANVRRIPALGATEGTKVADKTIHLHYFVGGSDWYVAELDTDTGMAFGWAEVIAGCGEWGYFSLVELEQVRANGRGLPLVVERDCYWDRKTFAEIVR